MREDMIRNSVIFLLLISFLSGQSFALSWHVEKDGSGDFSVIQDAVNVAADGDTVFIGPGRFEEFGTTRADDRTTHIYLDLLGKSLAIIGAGAELTFIGPAEIDFHPWPGPFVYILGAIECPELVVKNITMDHSPWAMLRVEQVGNLIVSECTIKEGQFGVFGSISSRGFISNCLFEDISSDGVGIFEPTPGCTVENCRFINVFKPVSVNWNPAHCDVVNCELDGGRPGVSSPFGRTGVGFSGGGSGSVSNCTIRGFENYGVTISEDGDITVTNNIIEQTSGWGMAMSGAINTVIRQNTISTQTGKCLYLPRPSNGMVFEGNDLSRGDGDYVKTSDYWPYNPPAYFHLEDNYWGTTDAEEISAHIQDGNYFEDSNMFVIFEPFADSSIVATQKKSMSQMRAMFR